MTKRNQSSFKVCLLLITLIIFLLLKNLAHSPFTETGPEDCESKTNMERDECFSKLANELHNYALCDQILSPVVKDICHWDATLSDFYECNLIKNPYMQYICLRLGSRPHMVYFVSRPCPSTTTTPPNLTTERQEMPFSSQVKTVPRNLLEECSGYDDYHRPFCVYQSVALRGENDITTALAICARISDEQSRGECKFYIATSIAMSIEERTDVKIEALMNLCRDVSNLPWKAECYYILADELALFQPAAYVEEIADACEASNEARDYNCPNHVAELMPMENGIQFCEAIDDQNKQACWEGWGWERGRSASRGNATLTDPCEDAPTEWRKDCWEGFGSSSTTDFTDNISAGLEWCQSFPSGVKDFCLDILAREFGADLTGDIERRVDACRRGLPESMHARCLDGVATTLGRDSVDDVEGGIQNCTHLPDKAEELCLKTLGSFMARVYPNEVQLLSEACSKLPDHLQRGCLTGLADQ